MVAIENYRRQGSYATNINGGAHNLVDDTENEIDGWIVIDAQFVISWLAGWLFSTTIQWYRAPFVELCIINENLGQTMTNQHL